MAIFNLQESVEYIHTCIKAGKGGFLMQTEFGKVVVEIFTYGYDIFDPVDVVEWTYAPNTRFCLDNADVSADYYMSIGDCGKSSLLRHIHIVQAMIKLLFMNCLHQKVDQKVYDAAVTLYLKEFENKNLSQNLLEKEFGKCNLSLIQKSSKLIDAMLSNLILMRVENAQDVIKESDMILKQYKNTYHFVSPDLQYVEEHICEPILGVLLYVASKDPSISLSFERETYHMIVHESRTIQMDKIPRGKETRLLTSYPVIRKESN